jgi:hypothetical protein
MLVNHYKPAIRFPFLTKYLIAKVYFIKNIEEGMEVELSLA